MVIVDLCTYNPLQLLISDMGGYEFPTMCIAIILCNDSNDNGNVFKSFITIYGSCAKLTMFALSVCWLVALPMLVYLNLTNIVL
jgi:hypothetical protein